MSPTTDWYKIEVIGEQRATRIAMGSWCEDQFGSPWQAVDDPYGRWCYFWCGPRDHAYYSFHFRELTDAALFALRWS
jgi:hypothetical protein